MFERRSILMKVGLATLWLVLSTGCCIAEESRSSVLSDFSYRPPEPPATWELTIIKKPMKAGDQLEAQITLRFTKMPDCGGWDSVWQAQIVITRPDNSQKKYTSPLTPIVVGRNETYFVSEMAALEGTYQIGGIIMSCTAKSDMDPQGKRGNHFAFMSRIVDKVDSIPRTKPVVLDTGWHHMGNGVMIKKSDELPPEIQGQKRLVVDKDAFPVESHPADSARPPKLRFLITEKDTQKAGIVTIGGMMAEGNVLQEIVIAGIPPIDSVSLTNSDLGVVEVRFGHTITFWTNSNRGSGHLNVFVGKHHFQIGVVRP